MLVYACRQYNPDTGVIFQMETIVTGVAASVLHQISKELTDAYHQ
jgi:hypothetical protein